MNAHTATAAPSGIGPAQVDWGVAASTAQRLVRPGPLLSKADATAVVQELRLLTPQAETHVRTVTGLGSGIPLRSGDVVDRESWIRSAITGLDRMTGSSVPAGEVRPHRLLLARAAGMQIGVALAFLSSRVLGQYDPFASETGRLLLIAPNIVAAQRAMDVPASDFRMWVCLHEATHQLQFTAVPWLRDYFLDQIGQLVALLDEVTIETVADQLPELVRQAKHRTEASSGSFALMDLFRLPAHQEVINRLLALSTLLEGHADHVMDAVGPKVVPSVAVLRQKFTARREGGGIIDRVLRMVFGLQAKMRQYQQGAAFTAHVVNAIGMSGFNQVWDSPETLPTRTEITDPAAWLRRVAV